MNKPVVFLTDYGVADPFVGICHAVIARIAPTSRVIDLTHDIAPQAVTAGAVVLADAVPYLPMSVVLAVVDPGVGGPRRGVIVAAGDWLLVGPDNGLLVPAANRLGGITSGWEIKASSPYTLEPRSTTFHGRDVFAPAAAHLATGVTPDEIGIPVDVSSLTQLQLPEPTVLPGTVETEVLAVDRFGNCQLAATSGDLRQAGLPVPGEGTVQVAAGEAVRLAAVARTFGDVAPGAFALVEDSSWRLALAVNHGSAAALVGLQPGSRVRLSVGTDWGHY